MSAQRPKTGWPNRELEASHVHTAVVGDQYFLVRHSHAWAPPTDIFEDGDRLIVLVEIAGMNRDKFNVILDKRALTITGSRPAPHNSKVAFHQIEVRHGEFRMDVSLPWPIDEQSVEASYNDGFLRVELPKARANHVHIVDVEKRDTD